MFNTLSSVLSDATKKLRVRSALNPMLWLCVVAMPLCFTAAYFFRDVGPVCVGLVAIGCLPVVVACGGFAWFAVFRPEKLQSEEYQIRHETLQIIQEKAGRVAVVPTSITAIANPETPLLPGPRGGGNA